MANTFKNSITGSIGTSNQVVYTTPSGSSTTLIGINIANTITSNIDVDVRIQDTSKLEVSYLIRNATIVPGSSLVLVGGDQKVVLESEDEVSVTSSEPSSADVVVSLLEIT